MPLPSEEMVWPPTNLALVTERIGAWGAWYSGSPDELEFAYSLGRFGLGYDSTSQNRIYNHPSQYRGGVVGRMARWFWGEPTSVNQRRTKLHVPLASDIATASADLLFSEPPTITVDDSTTQARLDEMIDDGMQAKLTEAADVSAGLGGVYLRVCWDTAISDKPWLSAQHADAAVPEWKWEHLSAVTFWRVIEADDKHVIRHLERHEPGYILNAVYKGTQMNLGKSVDLGGWPETASLDPVIETGIKKLTATYIPNMRPNKLWRNIPAATPLGRADISGCEPMLDALDETWSSWMRDIRIGLGRLIVPETYLEGLGAGQGARFDSQREVWQGLNMLGDPTANQLTHVQFAIRVQEHKETAHEQMTTILRSAGYAAQTFGIHEGSQRGNITAREIVAQERKSMITRDKKILYTRYGLSDALETLLLIDKAVFGTSVDPSRPDIEFGSGVSEDPQVLAQTASLLRTAEAASTKVLVQMVHPEWDEVQVDEEVTKVLEENPQLSPPAPGDLGMGVLGAGGPPGAADPNALAAAGAGY